MSTCISTHGEYSEHTPENGTFVCGRCGVEDWPEAMAHIARLTERLDLALDMHRVQYERANRVTAERDAIANQYDNNLSRLIDAEQQLGRCLCAPFPHGDGPEERCGMHGRRYYEWVERGEILNARLEAVKEVIAKARRTPSANDPYHVAMDIADDLEVAVYLDPSADGSVDDLRAALTGTPPEPAECCASGRCEVCSPGFDWGRDG